jgi:hypothetical protein
MSSTMTAIFDFSLIFALPNRKADPVSNLDTLFEAGCDDATVGAGRPGMIGLDFSRQAATAEEAVATAIRDVQNAIPGADLIEAGPDLVNLTDVASHLGVTKQNIRKYAAGEIRAVNAAFPPPVYSGSPSLWHLYDVALWIMTNTKLIVHSELLDIAKVTYDQNLRLQKRHLDYGAEPISKGKPFA